MWTTSRFDRDYGQTVRTLFGGWHRWRSFFLPLEFVDAADKKKYGKGNDDETDNGIHEHAVVESNRAGCFCFSQ